METKNERKSTESSTAICGSAIGVGTDTKCFSCGTKLYERVGSWLHILGARSVYCSVECIDTQVERAKKVRCFDIEKLF